MLSVIGASFWKFVAIQQAIGMRLSLAKFLMDLCGVNFWASTPSARRRPRNPRLLGGLRNSSLISTQ